MSDEERKHGCCNDCWRDHHPILHLIAIFIACNIYLWLGKSLIDHATRHIEHTVLLAIHETKENTKR